MAKLTPLPAETLPELLDEHARHLRDIDRRTSALPSTSLPSNPFPGQRVLYNSSGAVWELVWTGVQWLYVGGPDLTNFNAAEVTTSSTSYPVSPNGPGVSITRAGSYDVYVGNRFRHSHTAILFCAATIGQGSANGTFERAPVVPAGAQTFESWWIENVSLSVGLLSLWYRAPNGGGLNTHYSHRTIRVRPRTLV